MYTLWIYGISHTPVFHPEGWGRINSKSSECKISRTQFERNLPEVLENSQRGSVVILTSIYCPWNLHQLSLNITSSPKLSQDKNITVRSGFDVLHLRGNNLWMGAIQSLTGRGAVFLRNSGKSKFYSLVEVEQKENGWLISWRFPSGASRSHSPGEGKLTEAELENYHWCVLGFLHRCFP